MAALRSSTGLVLATLMLAACGRVGPLEPPPASATAPTGQAGQSGQAQASQPPPDRPFILDPLIE